MPRCEGTYLLLLALLVPAACGDAGVPVPPPPPEQGAVYSVVLTDAGDAKINVIKAVRAVTGLGLADAKQIVDSVPSVVQSELTQDAAKVVVAELAEAGATARLEPGGK